MADENTKILYEKVITVSDYYDGPRQGVANFQGRPYFYDCILGKADYTNHFQLTPIPTPSLKFIFEEDQISQRWQALRRSGAEVDDDKPYLPVDEARYLQLRSILAPLLKTDSKQSVTREGHFRTIQGRLEVGWLEQS